MAETLFSWTFTAESADGFCVKESVTLGRGFCRSMTDSYARLQALDRRRLEAVIADRNAPQKHVWRAEIILLSAEGAGTMEIMRRTGTSKTCVWRWQERFAEAGVDGLLVDRTRPPGKAPASVASSRSTSFTSWVGMRVARASCTSITIGSSRCTRWPVSALTKDGVVGLGQIRPISPGHFVADTSLSVVAAIN